MPTAGPIAVYGATGYTGKLVVAEAVRRGLPVVISGRSADKLRAVAEACGGDVTVRPAAVDDPAALRAAFDGCRALVNCAGPFSHFGVPVVEAAIAAGVHCVDTTGEQPYMKRVIEECGPLAEQAGVGLVPAMGFDYLPGDLICHLAAQGREPVRELVLAYAVAGFGATRGTMKSALEMMKGGDWFYVDGDWRPADHGPRRARFTFPEPVGRQAVAKYPCGEIVTVPRHVDVRTIRAFITTSTFAAHPALAPAVPFTLPAVSAALRTPLAGALSTAIERLPEGPPLDERRSARFTIVAVAHGEDGSVGHGIVRGSDVYGLTAVTAVHGAALMAADGYDRAGGLAPAQAYDPAAFLDVLVPHGITHEIG